MTSYVAAGYLLVAGSLGLYGWRLIIRSRQLAAEVLRVEEQREHEEAGS